MNKFIVIAFVFTLLFSCSRRTDSTMQVVPLEESSYAGLESVKAIPLDKNHPFSVASQVEFRDGIFFLRTDQGLFCYQEDGSFLREISRKGRGPGEWQRLDTFFFSEDGLHVLLVDGALNRLLEYTLDGRFIRKWDLDSLDDHFITQAAWAGGNIFFCNGIYNDDADIYTLQQFPTGEMRTLLSLPIRSENVMYPISKHPLTQSGSRLLCIVPFQNAVYSLDEDKLRPAITFQMHQKQLSEEEEGRIKDYSLGTQLKLFNAGFFPGYSGIFRDGKWLILPFFQLQCTFVDTERNRVTTADPQQLTPLESFLLQYMLSDCEQGLISFMNAGMYAMHSSTLENSFPEMDPSAAYLFMWSFK